MADKCELDTWKSIINELPTRDVLEAGIKQLLYGGFDNFADYETYGDMFVPMRKDASNGVQEKKE